MKVLNLCCAHDHRFEGWFASDDDFTGQSERALIACPLCGDTVIRRMPSAPRLNVSRPKEPTLVDAQAPQQAQWLRALRKLVENTEDVGERFPEEARRIHYGEVEQRGIRGHASAEDADALRDEGIEVMALAIPTALKGTLQ